VTQVDFSILVPLHRDGPLFRRCVAACLAQDYPSFEVVVVTDDPLADPPAGVRMVETGAAFDTSPAEKRDVGFDACSGAALAFIDDDAFPASDWLAKAAQHLANGSVQAVGGPGLTPADSSWREQVGGAVYESIAGSGPLRHRFRPGPPALVDDYPAYNLIVRREALETVGGWGTTFYGGEDTVLTLKLAEAGYRILYAPDVKVFHQRRPILAPHLRQVANVGRHRGHFARVYPETSRRLVYFLPTLAPVVVMTAFAFALRRPAVGVPAAAAAYLALFAEARRRHRVSVAFAAPPALVVHHLAYGVAFLRGFFGSRLAR
jgi:GT2 family glycosyltransferase